MLIINLPRERAMSLCPHYIFNTYPPSSNRIDGVMVIVLATSAVNSGFESRFH